MRDRTDDWSTTKTVAVWGVQVLVGLAFVASGGSKLAGAESMVGLFEQIGIGQWFRYFTGLVEVGSGVLVFVPSLAWLGGALLVCTMLGAIFTHLFVVGGSFVAPLVLMVLAGLITWFRRP